MVPRDAGNDCISPASHAGTTGTTGTDAIVPEPAPELRLWREPVSASEHLACPRCGNGEFWLRPDGKIICADDDCYAASGMWWLT